MIIGGRDDIPNRFFTHNKGFDFAYVLENINDNDLEDIIGNESIKELTEILKQQIDGARSLLDIFNNGDQIKKFNTILEIKKV